jgi:transcriptional regulator with XRE-family HTH domain
MAEVPMKMRVRELREARYLSQAELAQRAGITKTALLNIEHGRSKPMPRTIRGLAAALEVHPDELFVKDEEASAR